MTTIEHRHQQALQARNAAVWPAHYYVGTHNVWYDETVHACECGFESHERAEVMEHIEKENEHVTE